MWLESAEGERGASQPGARLVQVKKEHDFKQEKDAKLAGHQAAERGRKAKHQQVKETLWASVQEPQNPCGQAGAGQLQKQPADEPGLCAYVSQRKQQEERHGR